MDSLLSPDGKFSSYLKIGSKRQKVRAGDGIHLSYKGYEYVAKRVAARILRNDPSFPNKDEIPSLLKRL